MVPPNQSTTKRADNKEWDLVEKKFKLSNPLKKKLKKYATRHYQGNASQLIRAAINDHFRTLEKENEYEVQRLENKISSLEDQISELVNQVEEIQQQSLAQYVVEPTSSIKHSNNSNQDSPTVSTTESKGSATVQNEIYNLLSKQGRLSVAEIAEHIDEGPLEIQENINQLVENRGFVTSTDQTGTVKYKIKTPNSN